MYSARIDVYSCFSNQAVLAAWAAEPSLLACIFASSGGGAYEACHRRSEACLDKT